jgi:hypothetical protein
VRPLTEAVALPGWDPAADAAPGAAPALAGEDVLELLDILAASDEVLEVQPHSVVVSEDVAVSHPQSVLELAASSLPHPRASLAGSWGTAPRSTALTPAPAARTGTRAPLA